LIADTVHLLPSNTGLYILYLCGEPQGYFGTCQWVDHFPHGLGQNQTEERLNQPHPASAHGALGTPMETAPPLGSTETGKVSKLLRLRDFEGPSSLVTCCHGIHGASLTRQKPLLFRHLNSKGVLVITPLVFECCKGLSSSPGRA